MPVWEAEQGDTKRWSATPGRQGAVRLIRNRVGAGIYLNHLT
ncbi:hypothetical protein P775_10585 [Puniceibacterium antarcticum]|uniref:Uncharacterized protein n=1 Tax=Puniceibacterium antarcticum TaxID=1206336 RepID=A0A2G8RET5_9RHOB|nr:hypothetical protein [Puniceibacterium antarcticum]PIL20106.1 hypothetical protein P775_10585 [Puniceibacterium antarcticum]